MTVKAGCEFDVPVRFEVEVDHVLDMRMSDFTTGDADDIPLVELVSEGETLDEYFYGGASDLTLTASYTLSVADGRMITVRPQSAGFNLLMPDTTNLPTGAPYFYIHNAGPNTITLKTFGGTTLTTISSGGTVEVELGLNSSAKAWYVFL